MPNNEITTADTPDSIRQKGIPVITMEMRASNVIPNAVDTTLKNAGEAADAKVVGEKIDEINTTIADALSDISDLNNQIATVVDEGGSLDTLDEKIDTLESTTNQKISTEVGKLIPKTDITTSLTVSGKVADAKAVGDAISALNGSTLPYEAGSSTSVRDTIESVEDRVETLEGKTGDDISVTTGASVPISTAIESISGRLDTVEQKTAANILYETNGDTIKVKVDGINTQVENVASRTANEILYETNGDTIKEKIDTIQASQVFAVHFDANAGIERYTVTDNRITADHVVASCMIDHKADITWVTGERTITVICSQGIPEMTLILCIPATN